MLVIRCTSSNFNVYQRRRFVCVRLGGGGAKREFKKGLLVLQCTSSNLLTFSFCFTYILSGDVPDKIRK